LLFSAVQYKSKELFDIWRFCWLFFVKMEPIMNQLDEIVIRRYDTMKFL
jgi:hypothetical protein